MIIALSIFGLLMLVLALIAWMAAGKAIDDTETQKAELNIAFNRIAAQDKRIEEVQKRIKNLEERLEECLRSGVDVV